MARGRHSYKAPMTIASHFGMTRKEWLKLTKGEKSSLVRKYDWETNREKMIQAQKKGHANRKQRMEKLLGVSG